MNKEKRDRLLLITAGAAVLFGIIICAIILSGTATRKPGKIFMDSLEAELSGNRTADTQGAVLDEAILSKMSYIIESKADTSLVLQIKAPDMAQLLKETNFLSSKEGISEAIRRINSGQFVFLTRTLNVKLDDFGEPIDPYPIYDAMYGGLLSVCSQYVDTFTGGDGS